MIATLAVLVAAGNGLTLGAEQQEYVRVDGEVYRQVSTGSSVGVVHRGDLVAVRVVKGSGAMWAKLSSGPLAGDFVETRLLSVEPPPEIAGLAGDWRVGRVDVNVRAQPRADSKALSQLRPGAIVHVVGLTQAGRWAEVALADRPVGYVRSTLLRRPAGT